MNVEQVKEKLEKGWKLDEPYKKTDLLSTGSTLLNLALTGSINGGFLKGKYFWFVGDSDSGKTFLTMTSMAEASINPEFDDYDFVFDNAEDGALMNIERFFGPKLARRLQPPKMKEGRPVYSHLIEDLYFNLEERITLVEKKKAPPFIWLLDSMDVLSSNYEKKKFQERRKARDGDGKAKGDYGDGKAKYNSRFLRDIVARIRNTGSILIIISQTRDDIEAGPFEFDKTASGGHALKFYATCQLWSSQGAKQTKVVNGKKRQTGITSRVMIRKNRITGKEWTVEIPIYHSHGIDDVGSCVDFLIDEKRWKSNDRGVIMATDMDFEGTREKLIQHIEKEDMLFDLRMLVSAVWKEIEDACKVHRKSRYH